MEGGDLPGGYWKDDRAHKGVTERKEQIQDMFGQQSSAELPQIHKQLFLWKETAKYLLCAGQCSKCFTCTILTLKMELELLGFPNR